MYEQKHDDRSLSSKANDASDVLPDMVVLSSHEQDWQGLSVMKLHQVYEDLSAPALANHAVIVALTDLPTMKANLGDRVYQGKMRCGDISILPAGLSSRWQNFEHQEDDVLHLSLEPSFLCKVAASIDIDPDRVEIISHLGIQDLQIKNLAFALLAELEQGCVSGRLYSESAAMMLTSRLIHQYTNIKGFVRNYERELAQPKLSLAIEFISENLAEDLTLDTIAKALDMNSYHFRRVFKKTMGIAPHQYILTQRVNRAQQLLSDSKLSITEIALAVGFQDQSHFTKVFHRFMNTTPKSFRALF
jgi:AraC family transcriptional regulator